ncbi:unnamed protein product [Trichogramma brassicae]|uniref:Uncharacterized protein n=1 Tax=Trichogramma brassicae TaxID=86971 RepID=A0A6H5HTA2_9HYME|nr:unnamed protein product [Trichogramma brassicae]
MTASPRTVRFTYNLKGKQNLEILVHPAANNLPIASCKPSGEFLERDRERDLGRKGVREILSEISIAMASGISNVYVNAEKPSGYAIETCFDDAFYSSFSSSSSKSPSLSLLDSTDREKVATHVASTVASDCCEESEAAAAAAAAVAAEQHCSWIFPKLYQIRARGPATSQSFRLLKTFKSLNFGRERLIGHLRIFFKVLKTTQSMYKDNSSPTWGNLPLTYEQALIRKESILITDGQVEHGERTATSDAERDTTASRPSYNNYQTLFQLIVFHFVSNTSAPARSSLHPDFNQPRSIAGSQRRHQASDIAGSQRLQAAIGRKQYDIPCIYKITKSAVSRSGRIRTRIRPIQTHHGRTRQRLTARAVAEATTSEFHERMMEPSHVKTTHSSSSLETRFSKRWLAHQP